MDELQTTQITQILGGQAWQSGGDIWLAVKHREDGHIIAISDEVVCEYASEEDFEKSKAVNSILLV